LTVFAGVVVGLVGGLWRAIEGFGRDLGNALLGWMMALMIAEVVFFACFFAWRRLSC
jgi:hypothetical protein